MDRDGLFLGSRSSMSGTAGLRIPYSGRPDAIQTYIPVPGTRQAPMILLYGFAMMVVIPDSPWPVTTGTLFTLILIT